MFSWLKSHSYGLGWMIMPGNKVHLLAGMGRAVPSNGLFFKLIGRFNAYLEPPK